MGCFSSSLVLALSKGLRHDVTQMCLDQCGVFNIISHGHCTDMFKYTDDWCMAVMNCMMSFCYVWQQHVYVCSHASVAAWVH